jgi:hypothetical protein
MESGVARLTTRHSSDDQLLRTRGFPGRGSDGSELPTGAGALSNTAPDEPGMGNLRRVVIDVLKPHDPPLIEFTEHVGAVESVDGISSSLIELDQEVQNVKLTVEGDSLEYAAIEAAVDGLGGTVHSVDQVAYGDYVVEERPTLQDD